MKDETEQCFAKPGKKVSLKNFPTSYDGELEKEMGKRELEKIKLQLSTYQEALYASNSHSVLVILQAMDAAGKDSAIQHVFSGINPQGCQVYSFKAPTAEEYAHDFLWRHQNALPERGNIGVHNRSHYENVLVCKVHPEYILNENIPGYQEIKKIDKRFWERRYETIRNFEQHLEENGTRVIKIFLHVSKEEQKQRFLDRINDPTKNWKFAAGDIDERNLWGHYQNAYEDAIAATSTEQSPWYIVPADKKWYARLLIAQILHEAFKKMNLKFPVLKKEALNELGGIKEKLLTEK